MIKEWLERNKIFFDTISATFLAGMALIVSILSIQISSNQLENDKLLNQPLIKISNDFFSYYGVENDSRFVIVENEGTPITEFRSKIYTILKIEANKKPFEKSIERQVIHIPIQDYFSAVSLTNNYIGVQTKYIGINNLSMLENIKTDFDIKLKESYPMTFLSMIIFMEISYLDYSGNRINKFFIIDDIRNGYEITKNNEIERLLMIWNNEPKLSLYNLTSEYIKELIIKNGS